MKDPVESSEEPDSLLTDSIQSKGKRALTLTGSLSSHTISLYKRIPISGHSCWIIIHFILSAVQPSVTQFHPDCLYFPLRPSPPSSLFRGLIVRDFGMNLSARLWKLSVMNCLQTQLSDV